MSLKGFHFVFIVASVALSFWFGAWCVNEYGYDGSYWRLAMGIASFLSGLGLSFYLAWFLKKLKHVGFIALSLVFLHPASAEACAVCFGNPNSMAVKSANAAVLFMLVVVSALLVGFAGMFLSWARRDRRWSSR